MSSKRTTIIGFGSLLSERSARSTFPDLTSFRLGYVCGFRRIFKHTASVFFQRKIADLESRRMASCSAEAWRSATALPLIVTVFEIPASQLAAFHKREEEFVIRTVPYWEGPPPPPDARGRTPQPSAEAAAGRGLICLASSDEHYLATRGRQAFDELYGSFGLSSIWHWDVIYPCSVYLRHCVLAARGHGQAVLDNFLDSSFLRDATTTIRQYLAEHPDVMKTEPPPSLASRYSG